MPYGRACTVSLFGGGRVPRPGRRAATVDEERGVGEGRDGTGRHRGAHSQSTLYTAASLTGARVDILGACVVRGLSVSPVAKITINGSRIFLSDACPFVQALSLCCPCVVLVLSRRDVPCVPWASPRPCPAPPTQPYIMSGSVITYSLT